MLLRPGLLARRHPLRLSDRVEPLLLLDVDGVLNPFPDCPEGYVEYDLLPEGGGPVRLAPVHGAWLRELAEVFELAWASGWGSNANRLLCPVLGLPQLPVVAIDAVPFEPRAKVPGVAALAGDRPVAWVDDIVTPEARAWADGREAPTLLLRVDPSAGLTRPLVERLLAWAAGLQQPS